MANVDIPEKLKFLFERNKWRYKVAYGGRDGAKSHSFARALLVLGAMAPLRIACLREVQNSIADSVHKLLSDLIAEIDLGAFYRVFDTRIDGMNGTEFIFRGLSTQTRQSIKSLEGVDIAWLEEAQTTSDRSWQILDPTIRKAGSEIWASFNPDMETDPIYKLFVTNPLPESKVVHINYLDNPWRSKALDAQREHMRVSDPELFGHIYLGQCRPAVEGAIFYREVSALRSSGRLANVPVDPMLKTHVVVDLGFNDFMSILLCQRLGSEIRVVRYIEDRLRDIPSYSAELRDLRLNWGKVWLPHDGRAKTLTSASNPLGATAQDQFERLGWETEIIEGIDIEQGIRKCREVFPRIIVDRENASELVNRLGRYRRRVNADGQASTPMHNDDSHGADGFRYLCLVADQLSNDTGPVIKDFNAAFRRAG